MLLPGNSMGERGVGIGLGTTIRRALEIIRKPSPLQILLNINFKNTHMCLDLIRKPL